MKCYCVKCRAPTEIDDELTKVIVNKRGGQMRQGPCPKCGATCNTFLSKPPGERKVIKKKKKVTPPPVVVGPPLEPTHTDPPPLPDPDEATPPDCHPPSTGTQ